MQQPTVGRHVWFFPAGRSPGQTPQAAIICHVHSPTLVNLVIFDANGLTRGQTSVLLTQEGIEGPVAAGYCTWPSEALAPSATRPTGVAAPQREMAGAGIG